MLIKLLNHYKIPLLASAVICISLIALLVVKEPFVIGLIIVGCLAGTFILDLDYFIYAYFTDTDKDFSKTFRAFIKHGDLTNAFNYLEIHKNSIQDKILNSGLFQIALAASSLIVVAARTNALVQALVLSAFLNSIYRMYEFYFKDQIDEWFWAFKFKLDKKFIVIYSLVLLGILFFSVTQLYFY